MNSIESIFAGPDIYPEKIDLPNKKLHCCSMSRETYLASPFLDHRIIKSDDKVIVLDLEDILSMPGIKGDEAHYVFHSAFCCSTLFSRCLDCYEPSLVLREPNVLLEQASIVRYSGTNVLPSVDDEFIDELMSLVCKMLSRKYTDDSYVVIKPSDACNNIMIRLLEENNLSKCLLMYSDIERFLTAIFKVPQRGEWVRIRANELSLDELKKGDLKVNPAELNSTKLAALVWVLHMAKFRELMSIYGSSVVRVIDSEQFMSNQVGSVAAYLEFTGRNVDRDALGARIQASTQTHSKAQKIEYGQEQRNQDFMKYRNKYAAQVDEAVEWVDKVFGAASLAGLNDVEMSLI